MDQLFLELIGRPKLNPPKLMTIVLDNFTLVEDQAIFLRATLAIPSVKQLPLDGQSKRLIQLGFLQSEVSEQILKENWVVDQYDETESNICDRLTSDLADAPDRSLVFINDISRLELSSSSSKETKNLLKLVERFKRKKGHFFVVFYQSSQPDSQSTLLRDLEYLSDAFVIAKSCKNCYLLSMWYQKIPELKTLIPAKIETSYVTCKIGKSFWSADLLCFYDKKEVSKSFDPDYEGSYSQEAGSLKEQGDDKSFERDLADKLKLDEDADGIDKESTLPYTKARNPEESRIFYYPDKNDDIDEDDPDNDLGF